jgi:hypothetical protein
MAICKTIVKKYDVSIHKDSISYYISYSPSENSKRYKTLPLTIASMEEAGCYIGKYLWDKFEKK